MNIDYSIENLKDQIYDSKTKDYFEEVIQTYYTKCYRSSLVMLYSVAICDLIFKLEDLRDIYNEPSAKKILLEIEKLQKDKPKSPDWENKLVEMITTRTTLLEISDIENINQLQKHRHLSAHPVLNQTSILYKPNKDTVKSHIRNILEGVLIKPPILSKKIFNELVKDIATNKYRLSNVSDLKRFLNAKYLKNLRQETINDIFKKLWRLVFKLENEECNENREINFLTLGILIEKNQEAIISLIKNEEKHFEGILRNKQTEYLFDLLFDYPKLYNALSDDLKSFIKFEAKENIEFLFLSWFMHPDFDTFINSLIQNLKTKSNFNMAFQIFAKLEKLAKNFEVQEQLLDISILIFGRSNLFQVADDNFRYYIEPNLNLFNEEQLINLISEIHHNFQLHARNGRTHSNRKIKEVADLKITQPFNYTEYHNFDY